MKTIKIFATVICLLTLVSANAQTTVKQEEKNVAPKKAHAKKPTHASKGQSTIQVKKDEGMQTDKSSTQTEEKKVGTTPAGNKNDKPSDKTKMKQIKRPVKVTPK